MAVAAAVRPLVDDGAVDGTQVVVLERETAVDVADLVQLVWIEQGISACCDVDLISVDGMSTYSSAFGSFLMESTTVVTTLG
jgi:hypothetical protein